MFWWFLLLLEFWKTIQMICRWQKSKKEQAETTYKHSHSFFFFFFWLAKKINNIVQQLLIKCQNKVKQKRNKTHWGTNLKKNHFHKSEIIFLMLFIALHYDLIIQIC